MIQLKPGVRIQGVRNEVLLGINIASSVFQSFGHDCILTSVIDGTHSRGSLHYSGGAFDLRRRHIQEDDIQPLFISLKEALGADFDVILEGTHFHIEYQPKEPY